MEKQTRSCPKCEKFYLLKAHVGNRTVLCPVCDVELLNISQVGYADTAFRRDRAYWRGYKQGQDCVAQVEFPAYAQDMIAFVQGFITGIYDRVHYNSGDYLTF